MSAGTVELLAACSEAGLIVEITVEYGLGREYYYGTIGVIDTDANLVEIREDCHPEDSAAVFGIHITEIEAVEPKGKPAQEEDPMTEYADTDECPCCGQQRPTSYELLCGTITEQIESFGLEAAHISTGGGCEAIAIQHSDNTNDLPHLLLTTNGPLSSDRIRDLEETRMDVNANHGWSPERAVEPSDYTAWSINVYNAGDGCEVGTIETLIPSHPDFDDQLAEYIRNILASIKVMMADADV